MVGTGTVYAVGISGCKKPAEVKLVSAARKSYSTPLFKQAHAFIRDGGAFPSVTKTVKCDYMVVGTGISGITAALTLQKEGHHVIVVESEARAGGTAVSAKLASSKVPLGSVYFVEKTPEIQMLLDAGGIQPTTCPDDAYDFGSGELVRELWADSTLRSTFPAGDNLDGMLRFKDYVNGLGDSLPLYPLPDTLPDAWRQFDVQAEEWVKKFKSRTLLTILNAYSRSSMGGLLQRTNVYCLLNFYSSEFGNEDLKRYTFPGGTSALIDAVTPAISDIRYGQLAIRVSNTPTGSFVDCINASGEITRYMSRKVIFAGGKFQVPHVVVDLPAEQAAACRKLEYAPYMTLHIVSDRPLVEANVYDTWNLTSEFETDVVNPKSVFGSTLDKYVSSLFIPMDQFMRVQLQNEELFARRAGEIVDRFIATKSQEQQASVREVYCWGWGHGLVIPTPGSHSGIAQAASQTFGNIVFANTDCDAAPAIENAAQRGGFAAIQAIRN